MAPLRRSSTTWGNRSLSSGGSRSSSVVSAWPRICALIAASVGQRRSRPRAPPTLPPREQSSAWGDRVVRFSFATAARAESSPVPNRSAVRRSASPESEISRPGGGPRLARSPVALRAGTRAAMPDATSGTKTIAARTIQGTAKGRRSPSIAVERVATKYADDTPRPDTAADAHHRDVGGFDVGGFAEEPAAPSPVSP